MFVYILYNNAYGPQKYKIGKTKNLDTNLIIHNKYYLENSYYCHTIKTNNKNILKIICILLNRYKIMDKDIYNCHIDQIKDTFEKSVELSALLKT